MPNPNERLVPEYPFTYKEVAYRRGRGKNKEVYYPGGQALDAIRRTIVLVLGPLRELCGRPIYIVAGGGYDPLTSRVTGRWISHRNSKTTSHHLGGALDFRIGAATGRRAWRSPWSLRRTYRWLITRLKELGISGGVGLYKEKRNLFLHIDTNTARRGVILWTDKPKKEGKHNSQ